ncbi:MAG: TonB family protein [Vicingaceae bacterium]|jgi:TonB family protein
MHSIVSYFIEVNIYLVSLYFIYKVILQSSTNFKVGRPFLLSGILLSLLLPLLSFSEIVVTSSQLDFSAVMAEIAISSDKTTLSYEFNWPFGGATLYLSGSILFLLKLCLQLRKLFLVKSNATFNGAYYELPNSNAAYSFMGWIFIGSDYSEIEKLTVLKHEKAHVNSKHSLDILLCHALQIAFWPNPMVYKFKNIFQEIHEYQADELSWQEQESYLQLLVHQNFNRFPPITNQFKSSHLKLRVMRLKNQITTKVSPAKIGLTVALFATVLFVNQNLKAGSSQVSVNQEQQTEFDKTAEFPGGREAMVDFIGRNIIYPKSMKDQKIKGRVYLQFNVMPDGSLADFNAVRSPHEDFTKAAIRAAKKMPNWIPGEKDGKKIKLLMTLPINFNIPEPPNPPTPPTPPTK